MFFSLLREYCFFLLFFRVMPISYMIVVHSIPYIRFCVLWKRCSRRVCDYWTGLPLSSTHRVYYNIEETQDRSNSLFLSCSLSLDGWCGLGLKCERAKKGEFNTQNGWKRSTIYYYSCCLHIESGPHQLCKKTRCPRERMSREREREKNVRGEKITLGKRTPWPEIEKKKVDKGQGKHFFFLLCSWGSFCSTRIKKKKWRVFEVYTKC